MRPSIFLAALFVHASMQAESVQPTMTYQGELRTAGVPSSGPHDFRVRLFDEPMEGRTLAAFSVDDHVVEQGLFSLPLDFGYAPFRTDRQLWVELSVREGSQTGSYTTLLPRRPLTAAPQALTALTVAPGSVGRVEINPADVQRRVTEACAVGSSIRAIDVNGHVECEPDTGITGWQIVTFTQTYFGGVGGGVSAQGEAVCPAGKRIVGGGVNPGCAAADIRENWPRASSGPIYGWRGAVVKGEDACGQDPATLTVYAICTNN